MKKIWERLDNIPQLGSLIGSHLRLMIDIWLNIITSAQQQISMNQKVMCSKIRYSNEKLFCSKNKSLFVILAFMEGYSTHISSVGHRGSYTQDQHISQQLNLDSFKLLNNCGNKVLHMKLSSILLNLSSAFHSNLNHWNLSSDIVIHRNMKHLKLNWVIGYPGFFTRSCYRHNYQRRSRLIYWWLSNLRKTYYRWNLCKELGSFENYSF